MQSSRHGRDLILRIELFELISRYSLCKESKLELYVEQFPQFHQDMVTEA
jgi:hypothetical protein